MVGNRRGRPTCSIGKITIVDDLHVCSDFSLSQWLKWKIRGGGTVLSDLGPIGKPTCRCTISQGVGTDATPCCSAAGKVTAGLAGSNGKLPLSLWLRDCWRPGSAPVPPLV